MFDEAPAGSMARVELFQNSRQGGWQSLGLGFQRVSSQTGWGWG